MTKYSKPLKSIFTDYAFDKELVPDPDSGDFSLWDEIVVNNFQVVKVHVTQEFSPDFDGDDDIEIKAIINKGFRSRGPLTNL